jgi:maltooligosyltrehalose trehalohydrolase
VYSWSHISPRKREQQAHVFLGPQVKADGTRFRLWAPGVRALALELDGGPSLDMHHVGDGWWEVVADAPAGTRYRFRAAERSFPDPASRRQAGDVHGWSVVVADAYEWRRRDWRGRPWEEAVIYEVHVGIAGGFAAITARLDELAELGITVLELMPVTDFPGARSWGYDGVLPFAVDESYGSPDDFRRLVDEAHARGIMVMLDVVYNHFGPDGNYLSSYAPEFFRDDRTTPWGSAIDFRRRPVRDFFIENACYWVAELGVDGLRLDAVHAIKDSGFLRELATTVRKQAGSDRHVHLVVENEDNDATLLDTFSAQWNDDVHHALHVMLTGETESYYEDFADAPATILARALCDGFGYQGQLSPHRGAPRGTPSGHLPTTAFISFLQNHDQTGNRAFGERLSVLSHPDAMRAAIALVLLCPHIPLIFMGEEFGAREPFLYFTDHRDAALADAVREGRRSEFGRFSAFADEASRKRIPDPNAPSTFAASRPRGNADDATEWMHYYKALLAARRTHVTPRLANAHGEHGHAVGDKAVVVQWRMNDGARFTIATNLGAEAVNTPLPTVDPIWGSAPSDTIPPFATLAWLEPHVQSV